jgi:hypothetical protein
VVFLDAPSGKPRTGIIDALLVRNAHADPDRLEFYVVQLKGGRAGMSPQEMSRLKRAAEQLKASPLVVLHDADALHFLPTEPEGRRAMGNRGSAV